MPKIISENSTVVVTLSMLFTIISVGFMAGKVVSAQEKIEQDIVQLYSVKEDVGAIKQDIASIKTSLEFIKQK